MKWGYFAGRKAGAIALALLLQASQLFAEPAERRTALVIGNSAYADLGVLANPLNDARGVAQALTAAGFKVQTLENASYRTMLEALDNFGREIQAGGVGLFYFSGHGIQVAGENYLIPVGAHIASESEVKFEALHAGRVMAKMADAGNPLNIVILDACRNNPFARSFRSATRGLAMMDAPRGVLISYATAPGDTADDNPDGGNGLYTKYLLKHMVRPGLTIEQVMKAVRVDVSRDSQKGGHPQVPWEMSSLTGDFYFVPPSTSVPVASASPAGSSGSLQEKAERGDAQAQFILSENLRTGTGVPKDLAASFQWCRKAAEQGHAEAQRELGKSYHNGHGVPMDRALAFRWFEKAAAQGDASAETFLGAYFLSGKAAVTRDVKKAVEWTRKAAEHGDPAGEVNMGLLYQNGWGVSKDLAAAESWYRKALAHGARNAARLLEALSRSSGKGVRHGRPTRR